MIIHADTLPVEGLMFEGLSDDFDLGDPGLSPAGPLEYRLYAEMVGPDLIVRGTLALPFRFECVVCLEPFQQEIKVPDFLAQIRPDTDQKADLTPQIREDILLALPSHPRCDHGGATCPGHPAARPSNGGPLSLEKESVWKTLDGLKLR